MSSTRPEIDIHPKTLLPVSLKKHAFDVLIIGGGPGGATVAMTCHSKGLSVLIIEAELVFGECHYWGCIPSKALLRPAETIEIAKAVGGAREKLLQSQNHAEPGVNLEGVWSRRDRFVDQWNDEGTTVMLGKAGIDIVHGRAKITGIKKVAVKDWYTQEDIPVEANIAIVIATGSEPIMPDVEGLTEGRFWGPREAVSAKEVPEHLIILGAGAVGCEMATCYSKFGSKVTLLASGRDILPKAEPEASKRLSRSLLQSGVDVRLNVRAKSATREAGKVSVTLSNGAVVQGSELLIAAGRRARTVGLGLESVNAGKGGEWLSVDDSMCVASVPDRWLYVIGDPNGIAAMTHMSMYQATVAANAIKAKHDDSGIDKIDEKFSNLTTQPSSKAIPQVVFTDPHVAWVGQTVKTAKANGLNVVAVSTQMTEDGTFLHAEDYDGWAQWVIDKKSRRLVGATFVGRDASELLHASTVAIVGDMTCDQLLHAVPSFPTFSGIYWRMAVAAIETLEKEYTR